MDVKSVFLHGHLQEEIYMEHPPSFVQDSSLVCRFRHSLHCLKKPPGTWYDKMDSFFITSRFHHCKSYHNFYTIRQVNHLLIMVLYVNDLGVIGSSSSLIQNVQQALMEQFDMRYL